MGDVPAQLGGTFGTGAAQEGAVLVLFHLGAADRTVTRQMIGLSALGALGEVYLQNFRDDLTGLADQHRVTDADIPLADEILVVQRCIGDGGTRQTDGLHHRLGGQHTGTAHLHHNILHHRGLDLRGILVSHGPPGSLGGGAHPIALGKIVDLDHSAVDVAGELIPVLVDGSHVVNDFLHIFQSLVGNHLEFKIFQIGKGLLMGIKLHTLDQLNIEDIDIQRSAGSNFGIQLTQGTGCCVPGIGEEGLALRFLALIQLVEGFFRHEHLAPDDQAGRCVFQCHGDGADGL